MSLPNSNSPLRIDKIMISPKRFIYIKLWGPSHHSQWGMTRSSIEIQEAKILEDKQISYENPIRLPCEGATALIADLMLDFLIEGRQLNAQLKKQQYEQKSSNSNTKLTEIPPSEIEELLLNEFKHQKLSKTRILTQLADKGFEINKNTLLQALESLTIQEKITKESTVHTSSGTNYFLWGFP